MNRAAISADIIASTSLTQSQRTFLDAQLRKLLRELRALFGIKKFFGRLVKGDCLECVLEEPQSALRTALLIRTFVKALDIKSANSGFNNYGVRVMTTGERLKMFNSVTDTYLTIFLTLGGLGLLLGIFSFIIVVRKNIVARMKEITLYRSLGFDKKRIIGLLYKENIIIPLCAISIGAVGSLLGILSGFGNVSIGIWALVVLFLLIFIFCVMWFVKSSVKNYLERAWIENFLL